MSKEKEISWRELFGNRFRFNFHPSMLLPGGYKLRLSTKIASESKRESFPVVATFDESFVIQKLASMLNQLQPQNQETWNDLATKSYEYWQQNKEMWE